MHEDLKTLNKKIDDGLKQCKVDSDKLVKSIQHQTWNEIKEEIEEVKATSLEDIMREEMEKSLGNMASEIDSVRCNLNETRAKADKQRNKESRRNNVFFYKVPESNAARAEDRNKEDISFCLRLFNNGLQVGMSDEDLLQVFRLGRRGENDDPPRPPLVHLASYTLKNLIMESLYKLKHAESQYKRVIVSHNMTKTERD